MFKSNVVLFLSHPRTILGFFSIWLPEKHFFLRKVWLVWVLYSQYAFIVLQIIYVVNAWGDIDTVSDASHLLFTQASVVCKLTVFLFNKKRLRHLLEIMESSIFSAQNPAHDRLLFIHSRKIKGLCMFFLINAVTTCSLWAVIPLFAAKEDRDFPLNIWMPMKSQNSPKFELGYFYQMISVYTSALLFIGVDGVALSMIMFSCAQLDIIMNKVENIRNVPSTMAKNAKTSRISTNNALLVECIVQHQTVIRFIQDVEGTYHGNIFFQLFSSVAIICIICLRVVLEEPNSVPFFSMLSYMVTMLSQLFLYCWCGNELTIRSEKLRYCLYLCPWQEQDTPFKKSLFIAMERMKKPIVFRAGHYIVLSRPTFVSVLRSSYSYYAVINQTNSN